MTHVITNTVAAFGHTARFAFGICLAINMAFTWAVAAVLIPLFGVAAVVVVFAIAQESASLIWKVIA